MAEQYWYSAVIPGEDEMAERVVYYTTTEAESIPVDAKMLTEAGYHQRIEEQRSVSEQIKEERRIAFEAEVAQNVAQRQNAVETMAQQMGVDPAQLALALGVPYVPPVEEPEEEEE